MDKRTWANLYFMSCYVGTVLLILLVFASAIFQDAWGNWHYPILIAAAVIWFRLIKRMFRTRPKDRPGVWTWEMEIERHRNRNMRRRDSLVNHRAQIPDAPSESN